MYERDHFIMNTKGHSITWFWLFLQLLAVSECAGRTVHGFVGNSVTLPCRYDAKYHGALYMCWGRGEIPSSGCNNEIISTDGKKVTSRESPRYQLLGGLRDGDVSLTILDAQEKDSGIYGCRVHIPGWFNDQKETVKLIVEKRPVPTTQSAKPPSNTTEQSPVTTWAPHNQTQVNEGANSTGSSETLIPRRIEDFQEHGQNMHVVLPVLVILLVFIAVLLVLIRRRWKKAREILGRSMLNDDTVLYMNTETGLGLNTREVVEENIYQLDYKEEYEICS